jgi:hypothetical protein
MHTQVIFNNSANSTNGTRVFIPVDKVRTSFYKLAILDPTLLTLASTGSQDSDDMIAASQKYQAVSYGVLSGLDNSQQSDTFRAAYLISRACSISTQGINNNGVKRGIPKVLTW